MIIVSEFKKLLNELYKNNYIIVNLYDVYDLLFYYVKVKKIKLLKGKKLLIILIDDMNYYSYMRYYGYVDCLVFDKNKYVVFEIIDKKGYVIYFDDNDIVLILNKFVKEYLDFFLNGEKGVVVLIGYEGVLGYCMNELMSKDYIKNKKVVEEVVCVMKWDGWLFVSYLYGYINFEKIFLEGIKCDIKRWKDEVELIVGKIDMFVFLYGVQDRYI